MRDPAFMLDSRPRMDVQLQSLIRLQQTDIKIAQLLEKIAAAPHTLRTIEENLQQQKLALDKAEKAVTAEEAKRRRLDSDRKVSGGL